MSSCTAQIHATFSITQAAGPSMLPLLQVHEVCLHFCSALSERFTAPRFWDRWPGACSLLPTPSGISPLTHWRSVLLWFAGVVQDTNAMLDVSYVQR